jgi:CheY-like chemotaxis protein
MRLLVVDDEPGPRFALRDLLECDGHAVEEAEHAPAALGAAERAARAGAPFDLVLTDLRMPRVDGLELLELLRRDHPGLPVVLLTAHGDERTAVRALKLGAWDYVPKPYDNAEILAVVARARELLALRAENARLREELAARYHDLVGASPPMRAVYRVVARAAPTRATVLVTGESGTGKELVARALHAAGRGRGARSSPSTAPRSPPSSPRRAVRARARRVHRRGARPRRAVRGGRRRHALPRRGRRHAAGAAGQAAARARVGRGDARGRHAARWPWTCAWSPPRTGRSTRSWPKGASATTCATG